VERKQPKMKNFFTLKNTGAVLGPFLFVLILVAQPFPSSDKAAETLAIGALLVTWWITEVIPMPVVALLPLVLFPLFGISPVKTVASSYGDPAIFLFLGGFLIGLAIEKWNLHKRIALNIVRFTGTSGDRIILGFIMATGLLSMWLSNTATTMMMYPIAASVIHVVSANRKEHGNVANFALCIMLSIAYASNFGGVATIIGTPPNVAFAAYISEKYSFSIGFAQWMVLGTSVALLLLISLYLVLTKWLYPSGLRKDELTSMHIRKELEALGPMTIAEKRVLMVFLGTAFLWICKDLINSANFVKLDDTMIAIFGGSVLFMIPSGMKEGAGQVLQWSDTSRVAWGILLLFGGGIALAAALEKAGLIQQLGTAIAGYAGTNMFLLILVITVVSLFISEVMSNIAQVIVFAPVIGGMSDALHISPLVLGVPMTLAASCASMLPMGTPPNAIVFASGHVPMHKMLKAGFVMNIIAVVVITLVCYFLM
jgi:sodium-dependent dicarboxylate transporter 2/3/5